MSQAAWISRAQGPAAWGNLATLLKNFINMCFTAVGGAKGTNAATVKTSNTATYICNGIQCSKGGTDNIAVPAGTVVPISSFCKFLVSLNAAGTFTVTQGVPAATAALALLPDCPALNTPVFYFQTATDDDTFTPGTDSTDTEGITTTFVDLGCMPDGL